MRRRVHRHDDGDSLSSITNFHEMPPAAAVKDGLDAESWRKLITERHHALPNLGVMGTATLGRCQMR